MGISSSVDVGSGAQVVLFEDYLCGHCARLELKLGREIEFLLRKSNGAFMVSPVDIFDRLSTPPGYSKRCAKVVSASANIDELCSVRRSLLLSAPAPLGSADLYVDERIGLALHRGGIPRSRVESLLGASTDAVVQANLAKLDDASSGGERAVPTLVVNGTAARPDEIPTILEHLFKDLSG